MENEIQNYEELLKKIDSVTLIPSEELDNMDFYQLSSYMQTLNMLDSLGDDDVLVGESNE